MPVKADSGYWPRARLQVSTWTYHPEPPSAVDADLTLVAEVCYGLVHTRALLTSEPLDHAFARRAVHAICNPYLNPSA